MKGLDLIIASIPIGWLACFYNLTAPLPESIRKRLHLGSFSGSVESHDGNQSARQLKVGRKYLIMEHGEDQVVLLSLLPGDLIQVGRNGTVQARLAINLKTGAVTHPLPGVNIDRWEAEVCGKVDAYDQRQKERRERPLDLSEWDFVGHRYGIPKGNY